MTGLLDDLKADRLVYAHQLDLLNDKVLLVRLGEADLRDHSFLDQRVLKQGINFEWIGWREFAAVAETLPQQVPSYIFHIGHCGSTLLSRLVCAATGTQALREPLPLRTIAFDQADGRAAFLDGNTLGARLSLFERVWARGPSKTVVKATSICTKLMDVVDSAAPMAFIYQQPETHLAVVLAGENAWVDLRGFGQNRYRRLQEYNIDLPPLAALGLGELAALSWLIETGSAHRALMQGSVAKLDFDRFLQQPDESLAYVCQQLDLAMEPGACRRALSGPIMQTYSKAPEHAYGPELRNEIITESRVRNAGEIAKGMHWINRLAAQSATLNAAVDAVSSAR